MKNSAPLTIISTIFLALLSTSLPASAQTGPSGVCTLHPSDLLATFGYSASGTNLTANALIPAGAFAQMGTATGMTAIQSGTKISGRWSTTLTQNDSSGKLSTHTFEGSYTVDALTCVGDFSWDNIGEVFRAVFVNNAKQFYSVSTLPGVIIAYTNGKKL